VQENKLWTLYDSKIGEHFMRQVTIIIQSFGRDENGFNDDEEEFEAEITPENVNQVLLEAESWMNEREFRAGDLSGLVGVSESGVLDTDNSLTFSSIDEFNATKKKIPKLFINIDSKSYRHSASFGKRIEYYVIGLMLKEGLDVFLPMVDDDAIDAVIKKPDGIFVEVQIKARSKDVVFGDAALFAAIPHEERQNYWFVFYSERIDKLWIMSSKEFIKESVQNKTGKNMGKHSIWFNGKNTKTKTEHVKPQFEKYLVNNFNRILYENPNVLKE